MKSEMRVEIEIEEGSEMEIRVMVEGISELCDIEIDGEGVMIGWDDDRSGMSRLNVYTDDATKAECIVNLSDSCRSNTSSSMNK